MLIHTKKEGYKDLTKEQPEFDVLKLCGKSIRAAMLFAAKNDIRYYLNGVYLDSRGFIVATNGFTLIRIESEECKRLSKNLIINIKGAKIPAKATIADFVSIDSKGGFIRFGNVFSGDIDELRPFSIVDGRYPDIDRVIPSGALVPTDQIGINPNFMKLVGDAQKIIYGNRPVGAKFKFRGPTNSIEIDIDFSIKAKIIIMPCSF